MKAKPRLTVLFGSVTGKAESIAELIAEEAERRGFEVSLHCMSLANKQVRGGKNTTTTVSSFDLSRTDRSVHVLCVT